MRSVQIGLGRYHAVDLLDDDLLVRLVDELLELRFGVLECLPLRAEGGRRCLEDVLELAALLHRQTELTLIRLRSPPLGRIRTLVGVNKRDDEGHRHEQSGHESSREDCRLHGWLPDNTTGRSGDVYCKGCRHIR